MLNAFQARKNSEEAQLKLVLAFIKAAIKPGYKSLNMTKELGEETLYDEVTSALTQVGFDVIVKKYSKKLETWVSWEEGKNKNGNLVVLDFKASEEANNDSEEESNGGTILFFS